MRLFGQEIVLGEKIEKLNCVDISKIAISKNGEVIKKEDADKSDEREAYIKKLVQSDIDQQNKIALLSSKVYKLQKENAKVEEIKANADYQLEGRDLEIKELNEQLEREKNLNQCMTDNNEQLREQIKKMKCCENCGWYYLQQHWRESKEINESRMFHCGTCRNKRNWKLRS